MSTVGTQVSFADMGTPLKRATFVVVDLETTRPPAGHRARRRSPRSGPSRRAAGRC
ncbi:hypothetical protein [uncultured Actinomyces sp.]|uniref:hypothetical protein n=1 Tax=uncultured Actinomyces sp. TaxID=249061 RepID=UPI0037DBF997